MLINFVLALLFLTFSFFNILRLEMWSDPKELYKMNRYSGIRRSLDFLFASLFIFLISVGLDYISNIVNCQVIWWLSV